MTTLTQIQDFLGRKRLALVGVSRDPKDFTRALFGELSRREYDVVPVNPEVIEVDVPRDGRRCGESRRGKILRGQGNGGGARGMSFYVPAGDALVPPAPRFLPQAGGDLPAVTGKFKHAPPYPLASTSRIFLERPSRLNGLGKKSTPASSTP